MRPELLEYNFDWMLASTFKWGGRLGDGTLKERDHVMNRVVHFRGVMEPVLKCGPPGIAFVKAFDAYMESILTAHERGKKLALTTFCQSPAILYAMDVVPLLIEPITAVASLSRRAGTVEFMDHCVELGFTETSCSSQRGALGAYLAGLCEMPDFALIDTCGICDTNANAFAFGTAYLDIPFYQINYPPTLNDERAKAYHRQDYREMIGFIEAQTGKKLDQDRLKEVLHEIEKQDAIICELQDFQRLVPNPVPNLYNLFIYAVRFPMAGAKECTDMLSAMLEEVKNNAAHGISGLESGVEKARALFVYIDHYAMDIPLFNLLNKHGISHLGSILNRWYQKKAPYTGSNEGYSVDTTGLEAMIDTLAAQSAHMPMVKQIRGPYDAPNMWLEECLNFARIFHADFAVYMGTPGCRNTWGMVKPFSRELERENLPTLILNGDVFDARVESWEITENRIEEFLNLRRIGI